MNKQEIYALLSARNIWHEVTEHKAVFNMAEVAEIHLPYPEANAKNLFIRDDKKRNYYLITVKGNKRVDLKAFRQQNDTRPLTFASDQDLMDMLGLIPGAVTPLGLLNDREHKVTFWLDKSFLESSGLTGVHPMTIPPPYGSKPRTCSGSWRRTARRSPCLKHSNLSPAGRPIQIKIPLYCACKSNNTA